MKKLLIAFTLLLVFAVAGSTNCIYNTTSSNGTQVAMLSAPNTHPSMMSRDAPRIETPIRVQIDSRIYMTATAQGIPCLIKIENYDPFAQFPISPYELGEIIAYAYTQYIEKGAKRTEILPVKWDVRIVIKFTALIVK